VADAAASNDVAAVGRLLMKEDVNQKRFNLRKQPKSLLRRPESCTLLDIAVGSASVEVTKCLLEFHGAKPTRETLKMAVSGGNLELIRLMWQRLPYERYHRFDLMEVAADFHREEPLAWLLRDATGLEREAFIALVVERRLADALVVVLENGYRAWSQRTLELRELWPAAVTLEFYAVQAGVREHSGWYIGKCGVVGQLNSDGTLPSSCERGEVARVCLSPRATEVGRQALEGCSSLEEVAVPSGMRAIRAGAFWGLASLRRVALPAGLVTVETAAFLGCRRLLTVEIPPGVSAIGERAFGYCAGLTQLTFREGVKNIGHDAFTGCLSLRRLAFPPGLTEISARAFSGCSGLTELWIPSGVTTIGEGAFECCSGLTSLKLAADVTAIEVRVFQGCSALPEIEIPSGVMTIGAFAFDGCSGLRKVVIPLTVTTIAVAAFRNCSQLATLAIPWGVVRVGRMAFAGCSALTKLEIPSTVRTIGVCFIDECSALRSLTIPADYQTGEKWGGGFVNVRTVEHLTLIGERLSPGVVADLQGCLSSTARVIGPDLAGQRFGRLAIAAA
jgi:hypothetical protein